MARVLIGLGPGRRHLQPHSGGLQIHLRPGRKTGLSKLRRLSRTVVVWATQLISGLAILVIAVALGQSATLRSPLALYSILLFAPLMGLGVGLTLASLSRFVPVLSRLVLSLLRMLFLVSGVFFQVSELPSRLSELLLANPVAQLIEYLRYGFSASSAAPSYSIAYIAARTLLPLCLGLLLERHARGRTGK